MKKLVVSTLVAFAFLTCHAQSLYIPGGYVSGNDYMRLQKIPRMNYLQGLFDGFMLAPLLASTNKTKAAKIHDCTTQMRLNTVQFAAIVEKYMNEFPEQWGGPMSGIGYNALIRSCTRIGAPVD